MALESRGRIDEAITQYRQVVKIKPDHVEAGYHLGTTLAGRGQFKEAIAQFERVVAICPTYAEARNNLGAALQSQGRIDEAVTQYRKALQIKPDYIRVYFNLGRLLAGRGQFKEAIAQFERALKLKPDDVEVQNILAWLLATSPEPSLRSGAAAIEHALRADRLCGGKRVDVLDTLAAAYAEAGRRPEAAATAHKALDLAVQQGNQHLADALRAQDRTIRSGKGLSRDATGSLAPPAPTITHGDSVSGNGLPAV